ncbi:hypothetical protein EIN_087230 [Entamoeba invadens IP1]|uniref:hypothetical protein n=1 Tax=Entamoeba invadens IP1 TaxID=370355 RepID=UPI0002C3FB2B|nr:hypothetical protein EIN_087230 [Entamoeba invadens IP1]ELP85421.1 hypothetical protein EIN_087230 [Entamoeba invadens IP1]|eukprot:XP_004184767.1 hypothetical protein EIN_087230 [Entamoeba invadens IP1]
MKHHDAFNLGQNHIQFLNAMGFHHKVKSSNICAFKNNHLTIDHIVSPSEKTKDVLRSFFVDYVKLMKVNNKPMNEIAATIPVVESMSEEDKKIFIAGRELKFNDDWFRSLPNDKVNRWWYILEFAYSLDETL